MYFRSLRRQVDHAGMLVRCSTESYGCCAPAPRGETFRRNLGLGRRAGGCSINGMQTGPWPRFCIDCKPRLSRRARSTNQLWCIDGTTVRAARCAAGGGKKVTREEPCDHALGRSRGGFSTKIHILCDGNGLPLDFHLTAGQTHESTVLDELLISADQSLLDEERRTNRLAIRPRWRQGIPG